MIDIATSDIRFASRRLSRESLVDNPSIELIAGDLGDGRVRGAKRHEQTYGGQAKKINHAPARIKIPVTHVSG